MHKVRALKSVRDITAGLLLSTAVAAIVPATAQEITVPPPSLGLGEGLSKDLIPPASVVVQPPAAAPAVSTETPAAPAASASATPAAPTPPATPASISPPPAAPTTAAVAPSAPQFALRTEIAEEIARERSITREDRETVAKFYDARQGVPLWVDANGMTSKAKAALTEFDRAADYALAPGAFKVPALAGTTNAALADYEIALTSAALRYARHARGGRMDPMALSKAIDRKPQLLPTADVLKALAENSDAAAALRGFHPKHPQFEALRQKLLKLRAGESVVEIPEPAEPAPTAKGKKAAAAPAAPSAATIERKLVTNMEMWRWMPDLGDYYIQSNIPEYQFRVVRGGKLIHTERIIVGKPVTMTPIFSDEMRLVVFKPFWNVPESIKWKELQPQLMRSGGALSKAGLRAQINGRDVDPNSFEWDLADMRQVHIFQPPGPGNALGQVKFLFPNKHDVYMHDTPTKNLFSTNVRAYSHGCMRVRDPLKFAEVILGNDKGWSRDQINRLANAGPENNEVKLDRKIPVHITYFTAWVDDDGKLKTVNDIYGHENRVQLGIEGKTHLIQQPKDEKFAPPTREERMRIAQQRRQQQAQQDPVGNLFKSLFNF